MVHHFFRLASDEGLGTKQIEKAALDRLKQHNWPGNIRELETMIRKLTALCPDDVITELVVSSEFDQREEPQLMSGIAEEKTLNASVERHLTTYFNQFNDDLPPPGLYHRILREIEEPLLIATLSATRGNQIKAAELLGLNRNTLRKKIKDLQIPVIRVSL